MKVACQTILWGSKLEDPSHVFGTIRDLGFDGVEICQPPSFLPVATELVDMLRQSNLELLGFYGGSLTDRVRYCSGIIRPHYLCIEDWQDPACRDAIKDGFKLALHPHMFRPVHSLQSASLVMDAHPDLLLLPDTAHLFAARDDPVKAIRKYASRLAAVHFKDWTPVFGRSFHRYARGFVELGRGDVDLVGVLDALRSLDFSGWIVVEQDSTASDPRTSASASLRWLRGRGFPVRPAMANADAQTVSRPTDAHRSDNRVSALLEDLFYVKNLDFQSFSSSVLKALGRVIPFEAASVWEFSPTTNLLSLLAFNTSHANAGYLSSLDCSTDLNGLTVESQEIRFFDPKERVGGRQFAHEKVLLESRIQQIISIPVLNTYNCNHVELVIAIWLRERVTNQEQTKSLLMTCARFIAIAYEALLEDVCQQGAAMVDLSAARCNTSSTFLSRVVADVKHLFECEGVTVFLVDETGQKLKPEATTGLVWKPDVEVNSQYYTKNEGLTGQVWAAGEPQLTHHPSQETGYKGKSTEKTSDRTKSSLCAPLRELKGEVVGVIRCVNKHGLQPARIVDVFCESDLSIVDAIEQAMMPHLAVLLKEERRTATYSRLTHELKVPLVVIRGASDLLKRETSAENYKFSHPYADDIESWSELARRLLQNVDFVRFRTGTLPLELRQIFLLRDVLAPARNQIAPLLRERHFLSRNIHDDGFSAIPLVWVDRNQFQQVFFNLIANSIKYCFRDPGAFQVEVATTTEDGGFAIYFRDWGPGIPIGYEQAIFSEGVRGPQAEQDSVGGDGLGLWVVSRIIQAHGGTIGVSNRKGPTELRIWLPATITKHWTPKP